MSENNSTINWRQSVQQSYRSQEVNEIAKVLASLEPTATAPQSKLMLASKFEDKMFNDAKDLKDYRKKISKRLKKMQRNYHNVASTNELETKESVIRLKRSLRMLHESKLKTILANGHKTARIITGMFNL